MVKYIKSSKSFDAGSYGIFEETAFVRWMYHNYNDFDFIDEIDDGDESILIFTLGRDIDGLTKELDRLKAKYGIDYKVRATKLLVYFNSPKSDIADEVEYVMLNDIPTSESLGYPTVKKTGTVDLYTLYFGADHQRVDVLFDFGKSEALGKYVYTINGGAPYIHSDLFDIFRDLAEYVYG